MSKLCRIQLLSIAQSIQITGHSDHHCFGFGVDALELIMQCKANAQQSRNEYRLPAHRRTAHIAARGRNGSRRGTKACVAVPPLCEVSVVSAPEIVPEDGDVESENQTFLANVGRAL